MKITRCDMCGKDISGNYYKCKLDDTETNTETNWILPYGSTETHYDICIDCIEKLTKMKGESNANLG